MVVDMRLWRASVLILAVTVGAAHAADNPAKTSSEWYASGQAEVAARLTVKPNTRRAKNVILFIGDGMGVTTVTAARIFDGQSRGHAGEENNLSFEALPHTALVKTYNANQQVADSAGTASAMNTGVKTRAGVIGVGPAARRGNCPEALANILPTLAERAEAKGKATGVVTTTRLTHATPAAVFAHVPDRGWEGEQDIPAEAVSQGCRSIARQLVEFSAGDGIDVALGGGREKFTDALLDAWRARHPNAQVVENRQALMALDPARTSQVLGLFHPSHMSYMWSRTDDLPEPTLSEMTAKAIDLLARHKKGYYLMVEGGRIDHAHHDGVAGKAMHEVQEFARAVQVALAKVDVKDTLILVTADHSHVFTMAGYPTRGNPILGLVRGNDNHGEPAPDPTLALDGHPYTTLGYHNGPGAVAGPRPAPFDDPRAKQQALVPTYDHNDPEHKLSETHGGEDVALYAIGPWSHLADGVLEQHAIYHIITHAWGWR